MILDKNEVLSYLVKCSGKTVTYILINYSSFKKNPTHLIIIFILYFHNIYFLDNLFAQ